MSSTNGPRSQGSSRDVPAADSSPQLIKRTRSRALEQPHQQVDVDVAAPFNNTLNIQLDKHVNSVNIQIHNYAAAAGQAGNKLTANSSKNNHGKTYSSPARFAVAQPEFAMVSTVSRNDFGTKFVKRYYSAEKHVYEDHNLVIYSQTRGAVESAAHALSLGLSSNRATHVIILFDNGLLQQLALKWPPRVHLHAVKTLITDLGQDFECTKTKVEKDRFSVYLFAIKEKGKRFSQQCFQIWIAISYWAHRLELATSTDNNINEGLTAFLTSPNSVLVNAMSLGNMVLSEDEHTV